MAQGVKPEDLPYWKTVLEHAGVGVDELAGSLEEYGSMEGLLRGRKEEAEGLRSETRSPERAREDPDRGACCHRGCYPGRAGGAAVGRHLVQPGEAVRVEAAGEANECRPEIAMDVGDLAADQAADQHLCGTLV